MNFRFINETLQEVEFFIEPSTDEFTLKPNDEIKIIYESLINIAEITTPYSACGIIVIYLPNSTKGTIFINDIHVDSLTEAQYW
ncbi:hypothetical protein [Acinetobacter gerneri]|uniref:Uncharacterized protein n=1 Tax=Acinetobacter gerneri DSM 14967 = CIP 107464 = MTCC 9824 TaxID=1120926 RepID=N8YDU4_9GAMM|nr:hypothetical protein [Acinetobacter gerneri]ENV34967.1 hypothetical protein F960_00938 [Acinetobacter gerneri DSM 14967 = CIP 107464 = MTCC 9824]EPR81451.1 hypothetical protein L289_3619 [Acinetobacter gerneri DSM 14967 = CIP 107464 = MTCC 9824]MDV2441845.1 hypothetical protein [Acinetobacter gerneri]